MSDVEANKLVGAVLGAVLLVLILGFLAELLYERHPEQESPVYLVAAAVEEAAAPEQAEAPAPPPIAARLAGADPAAGGKEAKKCAACHSLEAGGAHKIGPNLWGVVGAAKARHGDFAYSPALGGLGGAWDYAALDAFLADPKGYVSGTKMAFPGLKDEGARADVIAYLRGLSESPEPLPAGQ